MATAVWSCRDQRKSDENGLKNISKMFLCGRDSSPDLTGKLTAFPIPTTWI